MWRFTFQAWSPTCPHPGQNSNGVTYNGSTLRANWDGTDFCLVELNNTPPANSGIRYAGWNRSTTGITETTILHHPRGDVMKITRDVNPPEFSGFSGAQCWFLRVDNGTTEGGSSGGPYFDQNHRIIGQHYGINDNNLQICNQVNKFGGRFDLSWTGNGTNATRLSNWLDPGTTGALTTNTTDICNLLGPDCVTISGPDPLCATATYTIPGLPPGSTVNWASSNTNIATITPGGEASRVNNGDVTFTATITLPSGCGSPSISRLIHVGLPPSASGKYLTMNGGGMYMDGASNFDLQRFSPYVIEIAETDGANTFFWSLSNNLDFQSGQGNTRIEVVPNGPVGSFISIAVQPGNACGRNSGVTVSGTITGLGGEEGILFTVSPNPASTTISVKIIDHNNTIKEVRLTDKLGNVKKLIKYGKGVKTVNLNISDLPTDIYYLRMFNGVKWISKAITKIN